MYGRAIRFVINKNVQQSAVGLGNYPRSSFFLSTQSNYKNRNLVDDIRESASGLPPAPSSAPDDDINVVKTSTTPSSSSPSLERRVKDGDKTGYGLPPFERREDDRDKSSYAADAAKQGVVKAMETGLNIGEMAKQKLDNAWDATKDTTHKVKKVVTGDEDKKYDVPETDHFVDDLRKRADGYDLRNERKGSGVNDI